MNKPEGFYNARYAGIGCYFNPESGEIMPKSLLSQIALDVLFFIDCYLIPGEYFKIDIICKSKEEADKLAKYMQ